MSKGMVTFKNAGRCGNFMFQAASTIGYALRHKMPFTVPNRTNDNFHNPIYLKHLVNKDYDPSLPEVKIKEGPFCYQDLPFKEEWRDCNIVLDGYWQTEKYFKEFRKTILWLFDFFWEPQFGLVSIHVRRGDYLKLKYKHPFWANGEEVAIEWIKKAMAQFPEHRFCFFSDDIAWCRKTFRNHSAVEFSEGKDIIGDMVDISCCVHHINSASTFAWWGAWLNRNLHKRVIVPPFWFTPGHGNLDTSDIVPEEWERLSL